MVIKVQVSSSAEYHYLLWIGKRCHQDITFCDVCRLNDRVSIIMEDASCMPAGK